MWWHEQWQTSAVKVTLIFLYAQLQDRCVKKQKTKKKAAAQNHLLAILIIKTTRGTGSQWQRGSPLIIVLLSFESIQTSIRTH